MKRKGQVKSASEADAPSLQSPPEHGAVSSLSERMPFADAPCEIIEPRHCPEADGLSEKVNRRQNTSQREAAGKGSFKRGGCEGGEAGNHLLPATAETSTTNQAVSKDNAGLFSGEPITAPDRRPGLWHGGTGGR